MKSYLEYFVLLLALTQIRAENIPTEFVQHTALFSTEIYSKLVSSLPDKNVIFSPFSIHTALGMIFMGADGATAQEIADGVHYHSTDRVYVESNYAQLLGHFRNSSIIKIANKFYSAAGIEINPEFNRIARESFQSEAESIDFVQKAAAARIINAWIEAKTNHLIKNVVDESTLRADTKLILISAIHFKANWMDQFTPERTRPRQFRISESETIQVDMMQQTEYFKYTNYNELNVQAIELPYHTEHGLSMVILLPYERTGLKTLNTLMAQANLTDIHNRMRSTYIDLLLPKFKVETTIKLNTILEMLGIKSMFTSAAQFPHFLKSNQAVEISEVIHKAFINVNEEGTEAAAVTLGKAVPASFVMKPRPWRFWVDRPFIFYIKDKDANIFFMGNYQKKD